MEEKKKRMKELVELLNRAGRAYYQEADEIMTNYEYDALYDELARLEKETGTMEVLLVSPVRPQVIILAKLVPYLIVGMINIVIILLISVFILKVPVAGNIFLLFFVGTIFTLSSLALGIMVSVLTRTQRDAVVVSIAGLMLPAIALSGFIFPLEVLPEAMQVLVNLLPVTLFISAARSVMIKGLGMGAVYPEVILMAVVTLGLIVISIKCFKNRLS